MFDLIKTFFSSNLSRYLLVSLILLILMCVLIHRKKLKVRDIAIMGLMIALEIVLSRFLSIQTWNIKIGFAFLPLVITAIILGPVEAGIVGAIADFLGTIMFPIGPYFPGFTLTALLTGMVWGIFLHKKVTLPKTICAAAINNFVLSMLLSTFWISILYGSPFAGVLAARVPQACLMCMVEIVVVSVLQEVLFKKIKIIFDDPAVS